MRNNQPVTQREFDFPDDATLMSTTDPHGRITYANATFVHVSGFSSDEIVGDAHNVVRHPDMPREAFADMWATLKRGEPWTALVKNRRKNGDHYWVRANAVPVIRGGQTQGYMSVRTKAARGDIAAAEALYRDFREGRAGSRRFHKGVIVRSGLLRAASLLQTMSVRARVHLPIVALTPAIVGAAWAAGVTGAPLAQLAGATLGGAALAAWWLDAQIARPLRTLRRQALDVATGSSRQGVNMNRVDEIGMTLRTINQLGLMFRWLIDDVSEQVLTVQRAINEIAQGNNDLSARTEQAATSVQQTAASMAQMTATVSSNAETATQANRLSESASHAAERGGQAVREVVSTMGEITESSRRISEIIGVIDGIAFQTNILALNAAVEAARAGEQGRGFAVVAGEVRALAQRSANAAKEIKALIGASVERVESGAQTVDYAGKSMDEIVSQVKRVSDLIAEISASTTEQSAGVSQVDHAVVHLDNITQQNAALVEESAAASESLRQQATLLVDAVGVFR
ncbi:PAS domain-containing methyl-accepting chemotaxis protein [Burkholderia mayonis]|uniref:Aerotaxis receptor Aer n=1 Tax=Burkholderia mayonis TaxID=1385591 RepID=A0A1B4FVL6_9BURK|nr:PAS domain-containing methyl-accepting chemotaxis protein [Burkholderia mayonis]AOJ07730.1 aerotaxis receptor Aer [Burkholderia mayonis]KVE46932.1 aerotaxis receptor Aer [Burkholderia mayonis]